MSTVKKGNFKEMLHVFELMVTYFVQMYLLILKFIKMNQVINPCTSVAVS